MKIGNKNHFVRLEVIKLSYIIGAIETFMNSTLTTNTEYLCFASPNQNYKKAATVALYFTCLRCKKHRKSQLFNIPPYIVFPIKIDQYNVQQLCCYFDQSLSSPSRQAVYLLTILP